jgi:hypothetical protein
MTRHTRPTCSPPRMNRAQRRRMAKLSPMARLVLEIMEEAHANGENTLTEDQISERVNAKMQAVAHAYRMATPPYSYD